MGKYFLIQASNDKGYSNITENHKYENNALAKKRRDKDQKEVEEGDVLIVYCTGDVPTHAMTLAFQVPVASTSADKTVLFLGELQWFPKPLGLDQVRQMVADGRLDDAFRSCGAQGFNISMLQPAAAQVALDILAPKGSTAASALAADSTSSTKGSPADDIIERRLADWLVAHWEQVGIGEDLKLYEENGVAVAQEYPAGDAGRIDILCQERKSGDFVIIELKKGRPSDQVIGQLARYIGWVKKEMAITGQNVRGIILARDFDAKMRYAALAIPGTRLLKYETRFAILPESPIPDMV